MTPLSRALRQLDSSTLLGDPERTDSGASTVGSRNNGEETLFEAVGRGGGGWDAPPPDRSDAHEKPLAGCDTCSLSGWFLAQLGRYDPRDEFVATHGCLNSALGIQAAGRPVGSLDRRAPIPSRI